MLVIIWVQLASLDILLENDPAEGLLQWFTAEPDMSLLQNCPKIQVRVGKARLSWPKPSITSLATPFSLSPISYETIGEDIKVN